jgi:CRP/FNR family transcriptional regulator/CRP/FNR family cyclic AMP-dependent transcriptional regulator
MVFESAYLSPITLFSKLTPTELEVIAGHLKGRRFEASEVVFEQGEPGDAMFIIRTGRVRIYTRGDSGRELTLNVYGEGDFFGEFSLIDGEPRSASAEAIEFTDALVLHHQDLIDILSVHPEIAISLMRGLVSRLRYTTEYAEDLAFLSVNGRVASRLLELMERYGRQAEDGVTIGVPVTIPDLAGLTVAPPEIVQRILDFYELAGILARNGDRVTVRDPATLRERVDMYRRKQLT